MNVQDINQARELATKTLGDLLPGHLVSKVDKVILAYSNGDVAIYNNEMYNIFGVATTVHAGAICEQEIDAFLDDLAKNVTGVEMKCFEKYREQERIDNMKYDIQIDVADGAVSCSKCGSSKVFQQHKQTRSADEATTIFYTCANKDCRKRWRVG